MQVLDYNLQNKGAAINSTKGQTNESGFFTYFVDGNTNNLHVCCEQDEDNWVNQRDNGQALNVDAAIIAKLCRGNKPRA